MQEQYLQRAIGFGLVALLNVGAGVATHVLWFYLAAFCFLVAAVNEGIKYDKVGRDE